MKTRLRILCGLFVASYIFAIVHTSATVFVPSFISGFRAGYESAEKMNIENNEPGKHRVFNWKKLHLRVLPKKGLNTYPDSFFNEKNGEMVLAEMSKISLNVQDPPKLPPVLIVANAFFIVMAFVTMFIIIYLPVQSFKVVRSIARDDIFDEKNILRIRRIGYSLILMFLIAIFIAFTSMATARYMVSLKDYRVLFPLDSTDIFTLIFGILVLIFAEILKIATQIKEEQDLTV